MTGLRRYANKRDSAEAEIVKALRKLGCTVELIDRPVDALVLRHGKVLLVEFKTGKGKLTKSQHAFAKEWPLHVLRTVDDAIGFVGVEF